MRVLTVNAGSSSVKLALVVDGVPDVADEVIAWSFNQAAFPDALPEGLDPEAIAHRFVHGGERHEPLELDAASRAELRTLIPLAPLHLPRNLEGVDWAERLFPGVRQTAVFDTAFFAALPEEAWRFAVPDALPIRRYGFHGINHAYLLERYAELRGGAPGDFNLITCHLGNGCSMAAIEAGRPVDTSMGFTPLEGLVMGTRCGDLDPGAVLHLLRNGYTVDQLDAILNRQSGLLGVSGIASDMRTLLASEDPRAKLAIRMFARRVTKYIGAYTALLGGRVDAVIFSGGIGEHSPQIRASVIPDLDQEANAHGGERRISSMGARPEVWVIPAGEEVMMARILARRAVQ
jgi:acetate kinase